jgi:hypothetical protein
MQIGERILRNRKRANTDYKMLTLARYGIFKASYHKLCQTATPCAQDFHHLQTIQPGKLSKKEQQAWSI